MFLKENMSFLGTPRDAENKSRPSHHKTYVIITSTKKVIFFGGVCFFVCLQNKLNELWTDFGENFRKILTLQKEQMIQFLAMIQVSVLIQ